MAQDSLLHSASTSSKKITKRAPSGTHFFAPTKVRTSGTTNASLPHSAEARRRRHFLSVPQNRTAPINKNTTRYILKTPEMANAFLFHSAEARLQFFSLQETRTTALNT